MKRYRAAEDGVELVEEQSSVFLLPGSRAWSEFLAWQSAGGVLELAPPRPYAMAPLAPKKLWIVGAGGFGREVFSMARTARGCGTEWRIAGFLNDLSDALDGFPELPRIHGATDYEPQPNDLFFCAIGEIPGRRHVCEKLRAKGAKFINLVQPQTLIADTVQFSEGIIVEGFTGIGAHSVIGDFSAILGHVNIAHDVKIGACVQVSPFAALLGRVEIGDEVLVGAHAVVLPDVKVGARAVIGAGAVVLKNVGEGETVFGVPAQRLK